MLLVLTAAALACRADLGGPIPPDVPPAVSRSAATEASQAWTEGLAAALATGRVTVILTEEQLTSALAQRLAADPEPILRSPAVFLRDGTIQVYGVAQQGPFEVSVRLEITPVLTSDGQLRFELTSADFGPFPASEGIRASISSMLSEALVGPLGTLATGMRVTSVAVADGELAIVAELR
jgi:hypothetical protein